MNRRLPRRKPLPAKHRRRPRVNFLGGFVWLLVGVGHLVGCSSPSSPPDKLQRIDALYRRYKKQEFPDTPDLSVDEMLAIEKTTPTVVVDVREPEERQVSYIPGSISQETFFRHLDDYQDRTIITYCTIGYRSGLLAKQLRSKRMKAYNLAGGILRWVHAGHEVVDEHGKTDRVHVYGPKWNLLPDDYHATW